MKKAIFFDRDGVLIKAKVKSGKPFAINDKKNIEFTTNEICLFKKLKLQGYYLFLFTNQPDVARGIVSKNIVDIINSKVAKRYLLDDVFVCYHDTILYYQNVPVILHSTAVMLQYRIRLHQAGSSQIKLD